MNEMGDHMISRRFTKPDSTSSVDDMKDDEKENRSILKRTPPTRRDASSTRCASQPLQRHVDFQSSVLVFHFDRIEGDHVCSESQRLSVDAKDRKQFLIRSMENSRQRSLRPPAATIASKVQTPTRTNFRVPIADDVTDNTTTSRPADIVSRSTDSASRSADKVDHRPLPTLPPTLAAVADTIPDFSFFEDDERRLRLKFTIALGPGVSANDVFVKANMTGNKVRVIATRTVTSRGRTSRQELSERYQLPMEVDPYAISARMDGTGNLFVEAPILTTERRKVLTLERQKKAINIGFTL